MRVIVTLDLMAGYNSNADLVEAMDKNIGAVDRAVKTASAADSVLLIDTAFILEAIRDQL